MTLSVGKGVYQKTSLKNMLKCATKPSKDRKYVKDTLLQIRYFERGLSKIHKKSNLIFVFETRLFFEYAKQKMSLELVPSPFQLEKYALKFSFFSNPLPDQL